MTKRLVRTVRRGGNDVTDLHLPVTHNHSIDEQFRQRPLLLEGGIGENRFCLLAELLDRVGYTGKLSTLSSGSSEMALLGEQSIGASLQFLPLALELGELQYSAQVGVQQSSVLPFGLCDGLLHAYEPRL